MTADTTVVICCYTTDRYDDVRAAIASAQPQGGDLLVVVDHNDELLARLGADCPDVEIVPNARTRGLSGARNTALDRIATPYVAFLDDDAVAQPGWLSALVAPLAADPTVAGTGGRLDPVWDAGRPAWFPHEFDWVVGCSHPGLPAEGGEIRNPIGANMAFRTRWLVEAGGFQESMGRVGTIPVGCEETEASIRIVQQHPGSRFLQVPGAVVRHRVGAARGTWSYYRSRCYGEGLSKAQVRRLSDQRLGTEGDYVRTVLAPAALRELLGIARLRRGAAGRLGALVGGLAATTLGYLVGLVRLRGRGNAASHHHTTTAQENDTMYTTWMDIHGYASLAIEAGAPAERQLREMLRPFVTEGPVGEAAANGADIVVGGEARPLAEASHGEHAFRFTETSVDVLKDRVQVTRTAQGFEVRGKGELLTSVLPLVERVAVRRGAAMVHAATFAVGDKGVLMPAWGGVGKTSTVAKICALPEGRFMGDDWAFVSKDARLLGYAKPMFFKPHHRELYPHVFDSRRKPLAPKSMTDTVGKLATAVHPVIIRYPKVADVTRKWSPEHLMAHPENVFPADKIATDVPLALSCFVERYDGDELELVERDLDWMVRRVIGNFHSELPGTSKDLVVALAAVGMVGLEDYFSEKAEVLRAGMGGVAAYSLRVPASWEAPRASDTITQQILDLL